MGEKYHLILYVVCTYACMFLMVNLVSWNLENQMGTLVEEEGSLVYEWSTGLAAQWAIIW